MSETIKLNIGCGSNFLPPPWVNIDLSGPDEVVKWDITKLPLPYADDSVNFILCEHVTEHVTTAECLHFLDDCRRMLKPGGILRVIMPVLNRAKPDHARDLILGHGHRSAWTPELIAFFLRAAGFPEDEILLTGRDETMDHHWRVIGTDKDEIESARLQAIKR